MKVKTDEVRAYSSHGYFTFERGTGHLREWNMNPITFDTRVTRVEPSTVPEDDTELDIFQIGYYWIDPEQGRERYDPPVFRKWAVVCAWKSGAFLSGIRTITVKEDSPEEALYVAKTDLPGYDGIPEDAQVQVLEILDEDLKPVNKKEWQCPKK